MINFVSAALAAAARRRFLILAMLAALAVLATSCAKSRPPRLYLLTPGAELTPLAQPEAGAESVRVAIGPVSLPDYLNRPQMVVRTGDNQLSLADRDRWAEPLTGNVMRVLVQNLARQLPAFDVREFSERPVPARAMQVSVKILEFEGRDTGVAGLTAQWSVIRTGEAGRSTASHQAAYEQAFDPGKAPTLAAAMSALLEDLSRDIAHSILVAHPRSN